MVVFDDPEIHREATAPRSKWKRGDWYKGMKLDPRIDKLLSESNEKRHLELRSKMLHAYTGKEVPEMEAMIDERVQDLISLIKRVGVEQSRNIDFAQIAQYFTLDGIAHIAFGKPVGFLIGNRDLYDYNATSSVFYQVLATGAIVSLINDLFRIVQFFAAPKAGDKAGQGAIVGWTQQIVSDRFAKYPSERKDNRVDVLDSFIKHGLTQIEAESRISGGTDIALNIQAMTTRKDFFGADADLFRPERWIEADAETHKRYEKIWDWTFAGGQYTCPGETIALMETHKVIFEVHSFPTPGRAAWFDDQPGFECEPNKHRQLFRRFDFHLVNPIMTMDSQNHQLLIQKNMNLRVATRVPVQ